MPGSAFEEARCLYRRGLHRESLKAAVMVEDVARTLAYATMIGDISSLPQSEIDANHDRYINRYGTATASTGVTS